jgi:hypothetical protein
MSKEANLNRFKSILSKSPAEFKQDIINGNNEDLIINLLYFCKEDNIDRIIELIKDDEKNEVTNGNILNNLLQLEPLSLPIIDKFIQSDYLDKNNFCFRVDKVRQISSAILNSLNQQKIKIRNGCGKSVKNIMDSEEQLNEVLNELEKHKKELEFLEQKRLQNNNLKIIKEKIAKLRSELNVENIQELEERLEMYRAKKAEIDKIKQGIKSSENIFQKLPRDEA